MWKFIIISFAFWRVTISIIAYLGSIFAPQRLGFLGPSVWANFDGAHYLSIAQNGYMDFQEPFFPLYPLLIRFLAKTVLFGNYLWAGFFISHLALFGALVIFYKLVQRKFNEKVTKLAIVGFLVFPTSFYFGAVYTESLFLMLILGSFYTARKEKWFWAGIFGGLASATRLVGVFLLPALLCQYWQQNNFKFQISNFKLIIRSYRLLWLFIIPLGPFSYMWYLKNLVGDPLAFVHAQPAFGAQRSGGEIILLPQAYWRYLKILFTVSSKHYDFWIAVLEFAVFNAVLLALWWAWRRKVNFSYLIFSLLALVSPTLTGTFSSIPRYTLILFPIFIVYGLIENKGISVLLFLLSFLALFTLTILFTRGFFVA